MSKLGISGMLLILMILLSSVDGRGIGSRISEGDEVLL